MTVLKLRDRINRCLNDGLDPDAPVVIIPGNASVTSEKGYCPNGSGYYARTMGQREAFYLSVDDPRFEPTPKWDPKPDEVKREEPELKPCAHCGSENVEIQETPNRDSLPRSCRSLCLECGATFPWVESREAALAAWNRRPEPELKPLKPINIEISTLSPEYREETEKAGAGA